MSQGRSRGKAKGVEEFRPYVTKSIASLVHKLIVRIIQVQKL